ncbi:hypothetical protein [Pseudomonas sp. DWP1b1]|uniref:hypothetical protein n=1 Tax=Pseudomonadota TaxID=1224 RepID=UPI003CF0243F
MGKLIMKYQAAIEVFNDLAAGRVPNKSSVIAGALSLEFAALEYSSGDYDQAYQGLRLLACGGSFDLDDLGRARCAYFAEILTKAQA